MDKIALQKCYAPLMEQARNICLPFLQQYRLGHFWYSRVYPDGSFIDLGIHPAWFHYVLNNEYDSLWDKIINAQIWPTDEIRFTSTPKIFFDSSLDNFDLIAHHFKVFYNFNILSNRSTYLENFGFSAPMENHDVLNLYHEKFGLLKTFGYYFREQAASVIKVAETSGRITLPTLNKNGDDLSTIFTRQPFTYHWTNDHFKNFPLSVGKQEILISKRQRECLALLSQGQSCKEISRLLHIEAKTVEAHLLRIKDKTGLHSKYELIQAFMRSGL